jgi:hypothetical protein
MKTKPKKFNYFPNHGDEEGRGCWTICYGEINDYETIIAAVDKKGQAIYACKELNRILVCRDPELYRNACNGYIAREFKAKRYGGWTRKKANKVFDEKYWEYYRKQGHTPEEAVNEDSGGWENSK